MGMSSTTYSHNISNPETKRGGIDHSTTAILAAASYNANLFSTISQSSEEDSTVSQHQRQANRRISGGVNSIASSDSSGAGNGNAIASSNDIDGGHKRRSPQSNDRRKKRPGKKRPPPRARHASQRGALPLSGGARIKPQT